MNSEENRETTDPASGGEDTPFQTGESDLAEQLAEAQREIDQFKKLAQRAQADLVNFRNRVRGEQEALQSRTAERVAMRFIEVADQLEKALAPEAAGGVENQWLSGIEGIYQNLLSVLKAEGFERFDADGEEFDPRKHDALLASPSETHMPNQVIRQIAAGYLKNGEVIRPAQVEIAAAPESPGEAGQTEQGA